MPNLKNTKTTSSSLQIIKSVNVTIPGRNSYNGEMDRCPMNRKHSMQGKGFFINIFCVECDCMPNKEAESMTGRIKLLKFGYIFLRDFIHSVNIFN